MNNLEMVSLQCFFFFFFLVIVGSRMGKRGSEPGSPLHLVSAVEPGLPGSDLASAPEQWLPLLQEAEGKARTLLPPVSRVGKNRQSVAFELKGCVGRFPVSLLTKHSTGCGHNRSLFYQKGQAAGQCSIQAPRPDMQHPHAGTATQAGAGAGGGPGPQDTRSVPARAGALGSSASSEARRQRTGLLPHSWSLIISGQKANRHEQGRSPASLRLSILYRAGTALPTGRAPA